MRISDWSSDVCSSDLIVLLFQSSMVDSRVSRAIERARSNGHSAVPSEELPHRAVRKCSIDAIWRRAVDQALMRFGLFEAIAAFLVYLGRSGGGLTPVELAACSELAGPRWFGFLIALQHNLRDSNTQHFQSAQIRSEEPTSE